MNKYERFFIILFLKFYKIVILNRNIAYLLILNYTLAMHFNFFFINFLIDICCIYYILIFLIENFLLHFYMIII